MRLSARMVKESQLAYEVTLTDNRFEWARAAIATTPVVEEAATLIESTDRALRGAPRNDGQSQAWRQHVLTQLEGLTKAIQKGYDSAKASQKHEVLEARLAPWISGGAAAGGSAVAVFGATALTGSGRWVLVVLGVLFAVGGPVVAANTFVRNRNLMLRYLRLLHDIPDYAYLVLPGTQAKDAYAQLDTFRLAWETAGS